MAISYFTKNTTLPKQFKKRLIKQWIKDIIHGFGKTTGAINYIFCDEDTIIAINRQYLQHDYYTDILTFDDTKDNVLAGDLYISLETVKSNSIKYKTNFLFELYRVMIHGIFHLIGINDKTKKERKHMTSEENKALKMLQNGLEK